MDETKVQILNDFDHALYRQGDKKWTRERDLSLDYLLKLFFKLSSIFKTTLLFQQIKRKDFSGTFEGCKSNSMIFVSSIAYFFRLGIDRP